MDISERVQDKKKLHLKNKEGKFGAAEIFISNYIMEEEPFIPKRITI